MYLNYFQMFSSLHYGQINIQRVNSSIIPYNSTLNDLYIDRNDLVEIPAAFNKLSLESLHISNNKISALTDTDLAQLPNLRWIDLNGNPLAHVSPNAFKEKILVCSISILTTPISTIFHEQYYHWPTCGVVISLYSHILFM